MLTSSAFNALLKTIEEPPPNVVFIFATTELQKVPATIKSRCQQFNFRLIPIETIKTLLAGACKEMGINAEDEALFWIAKESTGSLRDAYTLFDQVLSFSDGGIRAALIREKLGLVGLDKLNEFAEACAANDVTAGLEKVGALLDAGAAIETFVADLAGYYHSLLLLKAGITRESVLGYPPERFSKTVLAKYDEGRLAHAGELIFNLHRDIRYSLSPRFELETLAAKLCWLDKWVSPPDLARAVEGASRILKGGLSGPLAGGTSQGEEETPGAPKSREIQFGQPGFLTKEFERYIAEKETAGLPLEIPPEIPPEPALAGNPEVETVLRVFKGAIVQNGAEHEYKSF
jgi:DNA polymerase-3 subunit gamma/tau